MHWGYEKGSTAFEYLPCKPCTVTKNQIFCYLTTSDAFLDDGTELRPVPLESGFQLDGGSAPALDLVGVAVRDWGLEIGNPGKSSSARTKFSRQLLPF